MNTKNLLIEIWMWNETWEYNAIKQDRNKGVETTKQWMCMSRIWNTIFSRAQMYVERLKYIFLLRFQH